MRSSIRPITIIVLLTFLLIPGLLGARTAPVRHPAHPARTGASAPAPTPEIFSAFHSVWNLLTVCLKSGGQMDPNGSTLTPPPPPTAATADSGGQMDPNGAPR